MNDDKLETVGKEVAIPAFARRDRVNQEKSVRIYSVS
jgi:hypothetical protein